MQVHSPYAKLGLALPRILNRPEDLISELHRELAMRRKVYPGLIRKGTLTDAQRSLRMSCLEDVLAVIKAVFPDADGELALGEPADRVTP